jgi:hypothetical protein
MTSSNKYAKAKIYKVVDKAYTMCYYGSTTQQLSRRMNCHRDHYKLFCEGRFGRRLSVFDIFDTRGVDDCKIELVEECPCDSKEQLNKREGFYIQSNECVNKRIAGRTGAEWLSANPEKMKIYKARWRSANPEKVKEMGIKTKPCDVCGIVCRSGDLARHKRTKKHLLAVANQLPV